MTIILVGLTIGAFIGAIYCWATSPTYRAQRRQWAAARRRAAADRRWARTHRIGA